MVEVDKQEQERNQVGLALDLITNKFAFADLDEAGRRLLGYREDQDEYAGYANVMARARDIVLKAIMGDDLPEIQEFEAEEEREPSGEVVQADHDPVLEGSKQAQTVKPSTKQNADVPRQMKAPTPPVKKTE